MKILSIGTLLILSIISYAQSDTIQSSVKIAKWKGNKTAAYSLNLDDFGANHFGDLETIANVLDTTGLRISFATVANSSACQHDCAQNYWNWANDRLRANEFTNHSWTHPDMAALSAETFAYEVDSSQLKIDSLIKNNDPLFFIFSNDSRHEPDFLDYIRESKHIGCNGGNHGQINSYNLTDPYLINVTYYVGGGISDFRTIVDNAISTGGWGFNAGHNVGTGGWIPIPVDVFTTHMSYCKRKVNAGELWVAPVSEVLKYIMERENFNIEIIEESDSTLLLEWDTQTPINPSEHIDNTVYNEALSLIIKTPFGDSLMFDCNPWDGNVSVSYNDTTITKVTQGAKMIFPTPTLSVSENLFEINKEAGSFELNITSSEGWQLISETPWLSFNSIEGSGSNNIMVSYESNPEIKERTGFITIKHYDVIEVVIKVIQEPLPNLEVSNSQIEFSSSTNSRFVTVHSNINWNIITDETWLIVSPMSGTGSERIEISVDENTSTTERSTIITVNTDENISSEISVIQAGLKVGLQNSNQINNILLYPNPTTDYLNIVSNCTKPLSIEIVSVLGKVSVRKEILCNSKIDIRQLNSGIYFLVVNKSDNKKVLKFTKN